MFVSAREHNKIAIFNSSLLTKNLIATDSALNQNLTGNVACFQISWEEHDMFANPTQGNLWTSLKI